MIKFAIYQVNSQFFTLLSRIKHNFSALRLNGKKIEIRCTSLYFLNRPLSTLLICVQQIYCKFVLLCTYRVWVHEVLHFEHVVHWLVLVLHGLVRKSKDLMREEGSAGRGEFGQAKIFVVLAVRILMERPLVGQRRQVLRLHFDEHLEIGGDAILQVSMAIRDGVVSTSD